MILFNIIAFATQNNNSRRTTANDLSTATGRAGRPRSPRSTSDSTLPTKAPAEHTTSISDVRTQLLHVYEFQRWSDSKTGIVK